MTKQQRATFAAAFTAALVTGACPDRDDDAAATHPPAERRSTVQRRPSPPDSAIVPVTADTARAG